MPVDAYCERTGPEFWAEPINALTNLAFLIAAIAAYALVARQRPQPPIVVALVVLLVAIGLGSFTFHTVATEWAALLDTTPITLFILTYVVAFTHLFAGAPLKWAWIAAPVFLGFSLAVNAVAGLGGYLPALLGLAGLAAIMVFYREYRYARWFAGIGLLFAVSLTLRTVDEPWCSAIPVGTHFLWHVLNATVLYLLIRVAADRAGNRLYAASYPG